MSNISKKSLEKFKKLYQENYGIELDDNAAFEVAVKLINLVKSINT